MIVLGVVLALLIALCVYIYNRTGKLPWEQSPTTLAANAVLRSVDLQSVVESEVDAHMDQITSTLGVSEAQVDAAVDGLDLSSWEVVDTPSGLVSTGTYDTTYDGKAVQVTTYTDSNYVTADLSGTALTFAVPESAQTYLGELAAAQAS